MKIATCQAPTLAELTDTMRRLYGADAVLLSVRRQTAPDGAAAEPCVLEGTVGFQPPQEDTFPTACRGEVLGERGRTAATPLPLPPPARGGGNNSTVVLVGPMGAGKTTTAAKIAGRRAREARCPGGVISTDVERPGGLALLLAYAAALGLHGTTAGSASDLRNRLARWNCRGPLVVDTRGCGPRDSWALENLGALLNSVPGCAERYLVLSATEHPALARECLEAYTAVGIKGVILTRVDQAAGIGHCLEEVRRRELPILYLGTGERVPEDLMAPSAVGLSALKTGRKNCFV